MTAGSFLLWSALVVSILTVASLSVGYWMRSKKLVIAGYIGILLIFLLTSAASILLLRAFLLRDFSNNYVFNYSSSDLPFFYTISAFWAGQEGSLLLWEWLTAFFGLLLLIPILRRKAESLSIYALFVLGGVQAYLLILLVGPASPFVETSAASLAYNPEGMGLNPLLQHPVMVLHPPTLFVGYAGLAIPFVFAIAALILKKSDDEWVRRCEHFTLVSWLFLGIGIFLGALWSYEVLGWGGYWAWDPVENASILPWIVATALIHSFRAYIRKGIYKIWTVFLAVLSFWLCIFATFLTRSGIISSVHAFGESPIASYFAWFLVITSLAFIGLLVFRYKDFTSEVEADSILSREYGFEVNNAVLTIFAITIAVATMLPVFTGGRSVSVPTYNAMATFFGYLYLILIIFCPITGWKKTNLLKMSRNLIWPAVITAIFIFPLYYFYGTNIIGLLGLVLCVLAASIIVKVTIDGFLSSRKTSKKGIFVSLFRLFSGERKHRYGGLIAHLGIVVIFIGLIGSNYYKIETEAIFSQGETHKVGNLSLEYIEKTEKKVANKETLGAKLDVLENGKKKGTIFPQLAFYRQAEKPNAEVAIKRHFFYDLFVALRGVEGNKVNIQANINPLISWLWAGSLILFLGTLLTFWPTRGNEKRVK